MHMWVGKKATREAGGCEFESSQWCSLFLLWVMYLVPAPATDTKGPYRPVLLALFLAVVHARSGKQIQLVVDHLNETARTCKIEYLYLIDLTCLV